MGDFLNVKEEIFRWGPIPGRYFYISEFQDSIFNKSTQVYKGKMWPKTFLLFKNKRMVWVNEFPELRAIGKDVFLKHMLSSDSRKKFKKNWQKKVKELNSLEKKINKESLKNLSDKKLKDLSDKFYNLIVKFWGPTIPSELGNYGADKLLEEKIGKITPNKNELLSAMEILTAPETISFYQEEEIDLSETKDLKKHLEKYIWLKNSYNGVESLSSNFFEKRKKKLEPKIRKNIEKHLKETKAKKKELISRYKLPKEIVEIAKAICEGISWQDERKKHIFIYIHYKEMILKEFAHRYNRPIDELRNYGFKEVINNSKKKRGDIFALFVNGKKKEFTGKEALYYWKRYAEESVKKDINKIEGTIASKGKENIIKGNVKIVFDPRESKGFKAGDILVAPMTSPEFIFLMKKSKAIITDAGGLTSHAAIVSREMKIPCIVNTKIATKVLKDGDLVEVDVNKGTITKL